MEISLLRTDKRSTIIINKYKPNKMEARDFYDKRIKEQPSIGSVELMEEYAKHIIEINFCDGSPINFDQMTVEQIKKIHKNVNMCVDWVNN